MLVLVMSRLDCALFSRLEKERQEREKALALQLEQERAAREKERRELEEKRRLLEENRKRVSGGGRVVCLLLNAKET